MMEKSLIIACIVLLFTLPGNQSFSQGRSKKTTTSETSTDRSPLELINLIAGKYMNTYELKGGEYIRGDWSAVKNSRKPTMMLWGYPTGVTLLGLQRVYEITHDPKTLEFVKNYINISADHYAYVRWQTNKFGKPYDKSPLTKLLRLDMLDDYGAMGASILECRLHNNLALSDNLKDMIGIFANQFENVQYRLNDSTLWRPNSLDGPTIWADDLFMAGPFIIRLAEYNKDEARLNDGIQQVINYASYLQDTNGVWFHAYFVDKKSPSCCKWGRANGWVAVAIAEILSVIPPAHPKRQQVLDIYKKHIDGIIKLQAPDGLWHQVLDHPELSWGTETSCSAQFMYSIARGINKGWLDASYLPVVKKTLHGLSAFTRISEKGDLYKVCGSTSIGADPEYYNKRHIETAENTSEHGDGLFLLALTEMNTLLEGKATGKKK